MLRYVLPSRDATLIQGWVSIPWVVRPSRMNKCTYLCERYIQFRQKDKDFLFRSIRPNPPPTLGMAT